MTDNLVSISWTDAQLAEADALIARLEQVLPGMVVLSPARRRALPKMGDKSEAFCRQALSLLEGNRHLVPESLALDAALAELRALDQLRPRLLRLRQLAERAADTELALGSDVMSTALTGYGMLKLTGRRQGLDELTQALGARFRPSRKTREPTPA